MKPEKALELVRRYSELTWVVRAARNRIAEALDKCTGLDGKRLKRRASIESIPWEYVGEIDSEENEKRVHLREWYRPDVSYGYDGEGELVYTQIDEAARAECQHCYAAHIAIQERKAARRALGAVKAAMTRTTAKPAILNWQPEREEF